MELELKNIPISHEAIDGDKKVHWKYKGDVDEAGKRSGQGVLEYTCSSGLGMVSTTIILDGKWQNDMLHGYGVLRINGVQIYAGNWFNGEMALSAPMDVEGASRTQTELIDMDALEPEVLEAVWMFTSGMQSAPFLTIDTTKRESKGGGDEIPTEMEKEDVESQHEHKWWTLLFGPRIDTKYTMRLPDSEGPRDLFEFLLMSVTWFIACLVIFLLFLS